MLLHCAECNATVPAKILATHEADTRYGEEQHAFCLCPRCDAVMLAARPEDSWDPDEKWGAAIRLYPPPPAELSREIPELMRNSLAEAQQCFAHGCYVAAAVMCRRTLEAFCHHLGETSGRTLFHRLEALHKDGRLDERLKQWVDVLRDDGNLAAHDVQATFTKSDAQELVDFTEALLEYAIVLKARFEAFQKRRAERAAERDAKPQSAPPAPTAPSLAPPPASVATST